jgi:hypothetical protein
MAVMMRAVCVAFLSRESGGTGFWCGKGKLSNDGIAGVSAWVSLSRIRCNLIMRFDSAINDTDEIHVSNLMMRCSW